MCSLISSKADTEFDSVRREYAFTAGLGGGLNALFTGMDSSIMWLLGACGLGAGIGLIGAGFVFRLTRKVLTLFQW
jgi:hypothetical protein